MANLDRLGDLTKEGGMVDAGANATFLNKWTAAASFSPNLGYIYNNSIINGRTRMVIYADNAGAPGALLAASDEVFVWPAGGWQRYSFPSPPSLTNGTAYWIGYIAEVSGYVMTANSGTTSYIKTGTTYSSGPPNPMPGGGTSGTVKVSMWVEQRDESTMPWRACDGSQKPQAFVSASQANNQYANQFTAGWTGTIDGIYLGLSGGQGNSGHYKGMLYADNGSNVPSTLIATTNELTPVVEGWNKLVFASPPSVTRGTKYWLAVMTDNAGTWWYSVDATMTGYSVARTYGSGALSPWSGGSANNYRFNFYAIITPSVDFEAVPKANAYSVLGPSEGVDVGKANAYSILGPDNGVNVAKANVYSILIQPFAGINVSKANVYSILTLAPGTLGAVQVGCCT